MNETQNVDVNNMLFSGITDHATLLYTRITDFFANSVFAGFSSVSAIYQLGAVALSVLIAYMVSRFFGARLLTLRARITSETWGAKLIRMTISLVQALLFSVTAATLQSVCVSLMTAAGVVNHESNLFIIRVAYQIFYAWAILYVILQMLTTLIGDKFFSQSQKKFVTTGFWILAFLQIVGILPEIVHLMKEYSLPIGSDNLTIWKIFVGLVTVLLTAGVANKLADICEAQIMRLKEMEMNLRVVFARICRVGLIVIGVLIALSTVGINLTVLSVFGGAVGVGIGFGMQKIASNYISGFIILFDRSVKLGDMVQVGTFSGVVTQINTRYSVLRNTLGEELIVPNENFVTGTVKNYSLTDTDCVINVEVSCAYEADVDKALEILLESVKAQPRVLKSRNPYTYVASFGASGINLKAGFWVADPQLGTATLKSDIMRMVLKRFNAAGIEIPYDKLDLTVKNAVAVEEKPIA